MEFEEWLRSVCFDKPTPEAKGLAKMAWKDAHNAAIEESAKVADREAGHRLTDAELAANDILKQCGVKLSKNRLKYENRNA